MTAPAYHVGQILYHRASGERAIVVFAPVQDGSNYWLSAGCGHNKMEFVAPAEKFDLIFSTEPVVVPSGFYPIEKPTEPGWYWWKSGSLWAIRVDESEGQLCAIERDQHWFLHEKPHGQWYGPKIPSP